MVFNVIIKQKTIVVQVMTHYKMTVINRDGCKNNSPREICPVVTMVTCIWRLFRPLGPFPGSSSLPRVASPERLLDEAPVLPPVVDRAWYSPWAGLGWGLSQLGMNR